MGGMGSGRWGWERTRETTEGLLWLDVRYLARRGMFTARPGQLATDSVEWSRGGKPTGDITVVYAGDDPDALILDYRIRTSAGEPWVPVRERVGLERTPCRYGGSRPWFRCPGCKRRRAVLYSVEGRFRCRVCHDLAYESTREDVGARANRRADKLRRKLGNNGGERWRGVPPKPRRMRWATYQRLVNEILEAEREALEAWTAEAEALLTRLERIRA